MARGIGSKITIESFEDLFNGGLMPADKIMEVPVDMLHEFKNHPFRVLRDEKMEETIASVKAKGILTPGIARPRAEGGYEIVSGHRRTFAARELGLPTVPMIIKDLTDEEATVIMVDANIQREDLLISEKAKSYRMKYEAVKGKRRGGKGNNYEQLGSVVGESGKTVQRYVALSFLVPELLDMVDEHRIGVKQGVEISALSENAQKMVFEVLQDKKVPVSQEQAAKLKEHFKSGELTKAVIKLILCEEKKKTKKFAIDEDRLKEYFAEGTSAAEMENRIFELLHKWKQEGGK